MVQTPALLHKILIPIIIIILFPDDLSTSHVHARHTFSKHAWDLIVETATPFRQLFHRDLVVPRRVRPALPAVSSAASRDIGHIDHALIHADASQNRCAVSMNQDITLSREISRIAIAVSGANRRDPRRTVRHKGSAVADRACPAPLP